MFKTFSTRQEAGFAAHDRKFRHVRGSEVAKTDLLEVAGGWQVRVYLLDGQSFRLRNAIGG